MPRDKSWSSALGVIAFPEQGPAPTKVRYEADLDNALSLWAECDVSVGVARDAYDNDVGACTRAGMAVVPRRLWHGQACWLPSARRPTRHRLRRGGL